MRNLKIFFTFSLLALSCETFAGSQHVKCVNPDTDITACWQTTGEVGVSSTDLSQKLLRLPFELKGNQDIYTNSDRSIFVQTINSFPQILIDNTGRKFKLQCMPAEHGYCF